jgi:hypothetical protein
MHLPFIIVLVEKAWKAAGFYTNTKKYIYFDFPF